ncbi:MAG: hypothetical protein O7F74_05550 [Bacteroidetes bacterium]|nr:hypothetical protein [Bacteroidota bacterium]
MSVKYYSVFLLTLILTNCDQSQKSKGIKDQMIESFTNIDSSGREIKFQNVQDVNNTGGHLQGVQVFKSGNLEYVILTGSSSTYSYYSIVKMGDKNEVLSVNKLLDKPYKHAGGFQVFENLMAVGIEDDEAKDKSKVFLFEILDPNHPPKEPIAIIERNGEIERATAGCIGLIKIQDKILLVVGDWDTKHLDFYLMDYLELNKDENAFELVFTIDTKKTNKDLWIDKIWPPYQNINILKDQEDNLYLVGFASDESNEEDVADLYEIETLHLKKFQLKKLATKRFKKKNTSTFRWGAGVDQINQKALRIISCEKTLQKLSILTVYR